MNSRRLQARIQTQERIHAIFDKVTNGYAKESFVIDPYGDQVCDGDRILLYRTLLQESSHGEILASKRVAYHCRTDAKQSAWWGGLVGKIMALTVLYSTTNSFLATRWLCFRSCQAIELDSTFWFVLFSINEFNTSHARDAAPVHLSTDSTCSR